MLYLLKGIQRDALEDFRDPSSMPSDLEILSSISPLNYLGLEIENKEKINEKVVEKPKGILEEEEIEKEEDKNEQSEKEK